MHLKFMHQSPRLIGRLLNIVVSVGFVGLFIKLFRPSEANFLFDGASLILYLIGFGVYVANIVKGLRTVSADIWSNDEWNGQTHEGESSGELILGREDSLKVLAASNTILALILVGILVLQAGQWYAEKREGDDEKAPAKKDGSPNSKTSTKKKQ